MATPFQCEIITPEKVAYRGTVFSMVCPGTVGSFGILARHAPLIARSGGGKLKLVEPSGERYFQIGPGLIETSKNHVVILTNHIEDNPNASTPQK